MCVTQMAAEEPDVTQLEGEVMELEDATDAKPDRKGRFLLFGL